VKSQQKTLGGIVLPETVQKTNNEAKVVAVGKGIRNIEGKFIPLCVTVGDIVLLSENRGNDVKVDGEDFVIIREDDILAKMIQTEPQRVGKGGSDIPDMRNLPKT